jgi:hypothetical protein
MRVNAESLMFFARVATCLHSFENSHSLLEGRSRELSVLEAPKLFGRCFVNVQTRSVGDVAVQWDFWYLSWLAARKKRC